MKFKLGINKKAITNIKINLPELQESMVYLATPVKRFLAKPIEPGFYYKRKNLIFPGHYYEECFWHNDDELMLLDGKVYTKYSVFWKLANDSRHSRYFDNYDDALRLYHKLTQNMDMYEEEGE